MEIPNQILDYKICSVIGRGSYGVVVYALNLHSLKKVAIKLIPKTDVNSFEINNEQFMKLNHPKIVKIYKVQ